MTTITPKRYTPTLDDCVEAFSQKKISPERTIAPGLLLLGCGLAGLLTLGYPIMEKSSRVYAQLSIAYLGCGIACALGLLLWRWEGKLSAQRKARNVQHLYSAYTTPKEASFDTEGWTVRHANGTEDKRKFAHLKGCWEKPGTIVLYSDIWHIFPKRIFSAEELAELRRLCRIEVDGAESTAHHRRRESVLSAFVGIMEYVLWRYRLVTAVLVAAPLVVAPWAFTNVHENPRTGMTDHTFIWWKAVAIMASWYGAILAYKIVEAIRFARKLQYGSITEAGFTVVYEEKTIYAKWFQFSDAHEGRSCFLFEVQLGAYQLLCKHLLSEAEKGLLRSKVASIKDGTAAKDDQSPQ